MASDRYSSWQPVTALSSVALTLFVGACGPTVKSSLKDGQSLPRSVAVLPPDYSGDIARERVDLVRADLIAELRNNGFVVADDKLVLTTCSSPACPEKSALADRYSIDGYATLKVDSFSKNNFLAGYYNALGGALTISDKRGEELVVISHTQSERGGVIFESGQVFQGIISQVKHTGDSVFEALATRFAKRVVDELPAAPHSQTAPEGSDVALNGVEAVWGSPTTYRICATGTPASFAFVLWGKDRTTLRETQPGRYCGAFSVLSLAATSAQAQVELRSAFGNAARKEIELPVAPPCSLDDRVQVAQGSDRKTLNVLCTALGKGGSPSPGCTDKLSECRADKLVLYRATSPQGPFTKLSEFKTASTALPSTGGELQLVAIGNGGISSLPASVAPNAK